MNKAEIKAFLASNPTEAEKQKSWDLHLKESGYKSGMFICCCGCYGFGWGDATDDGKFYLPGHAPRNRAVRKKQTETLTIWQEICAWILVILVFASILAIGILWPV